MRLLDHVAAPDIPPVEVLHNESAQSDKFFMCQVILGVVCSPCADFEIRRLPPTIIDMINGWKERQRRFVMPPRGLGFGVVISAKE